MRKLFLNPYVLAVIGILVIAVFAFFYNSISSFFKRLRVRAGLDDYEDGEFQVQGNTYQTAILIDQAFNHYRMGMAENEEKAMELLGSIPQPLVKELAMYYADISGENLYEDFAKYLSDEQYEQIKNLL